MTSLELQGKKQPPEVFCKKAVLSLFLIKLFLLFFKKKWLTLVFFCEFCEISKNTFLTEHLRTTASARKKHNTKKHSPRVALQKTCPGKERKTLVGRKAQVLILKSSFISFMVATLLKIDPSKVFPCEFWGCTRCKNTQPASRVRYMPSANGSNSYVVLLIIGLISSISCLVL